MQRDNAHWAAASGLIVSARRAFERSVETFCDRFIRSLSFTIFF
jgi:hypothetical protein